MRMLPSGRAKVRGALRPIVVAIAASAIALACVDLDSLGSGGQRSTPQEEASQTGPADAQPPSARFCDGRPAFFCDDFDDPAIEAGTGWTGISGVVPTPLVLGAAEYGVVKPTVASSSPFAVAFSASQLTPRPKSLVVFGRDLGTRSLASSALVLSLDIRLEELVGEEKEREPSDGGGDWSLPEPWVTPGGMFSYGSQADESSIILTRRGIFLATGTAENGFHRQQVTQVDVAEASRVGWIRISLAVGSPSVVARIAAERANVPVTCPPVQAAAALWAKLPFGEVQCVETAPSFTGPAARLGASIGAGLDAPGRARVLVDSVEIEEVR